MISYSYMLNKAPMWGTINEYVHCGRKASREIKEEKHFGRSRRGEGTHLKETGCERTKWIQLSQNGAF
jgi:hypothetical protein